MTKALTTAEVRHANADAIQRGLNRALSDEFVKMLDPKGFHLVSFAMVHNDVEMRTLIWFKLKDSMEPAQAFLDMTFDRYNALAVLPSSAGKEAPMT